MTYETAELLQIAEFSEMAASLTKPQKKKLKEITALDSDWTIGTKGDQVYVHPHIMLKLDDGKFTPLIDNGLANTFGEAIENIAHILETEAKQNGRHLFVTDNEQNEKEFSFEPKEKVFTLI